MLVLNKTLHSAWLFNACGLWVIWGEHLLKYWEHLGSVSAVVVQ